MDSAGLLNTMTPEELLVTCNRLQRSCNDMEMLLAEFEQEREMLTREQDRLCHKVEKMEAQLEKHKEERGFVWNLFAQIDSDVQGLQQDARKVLKAREERQADQRWRSISKTNAEPKPEAPSEDAGPFSEASLEDSWGVVEGTNAMEVWPLPMEKDEELLAELRVWVKEAMLGESVHEVQSLLTSMPSWSGQAGVLGSDDEISPNLLTPRPGFDDSPPIKGAMTRTTTLTSGRRNQSLLEVLRPAVLLDPPPEGEPATLPQDEATLTVADMVGSALGLAKSQLQDGDAETNMLASLSLRAPFNHRRGGSSKALESFAGARQALASAVVWVADQASNSMAPDAYREATATDQSALPAAAGACISLTVVLKRTSLEEKWGFSWLPDGFRDRGERVVESIREDLVAGAWNKQVEESGHPERCIRPMDRLVSVNGKTTANDMKTELAGKEVVLEFQRKTAQASQATQSRPDSVGGAADGASEAEKASPQKGFAAAFSTYMQTQKGPEDGAPEEERAAASRSGVPSRFEPRPRVSTSLTRANLAAVEAWDAPNVQVFRIASDAGFAHADPETPLSSRPSQPHTPKPKVAAGLSAFLAQHSRQPSASSSAPPRPPPIARAATAPVVESPDAAAARGDGTQSGMLDPLRMSCPRVVSSRTSSDAMAEKRDIGERLALRHGLPSPSSTWPPLRESPGSNRSSHDFDDDSLAKLSMALSNLERTARSTANKSGESGPLDRNVSLSFDGAFEAFQKPLRQAASAAEPAEEVQQTTLQKPVVVPKASFAAAFAAQGSSSIAEAAAAKLSQAEAQRLTAEAEDEVPAAQVLQHVTPAEVASSSAAPVPAAAPVAAKEAPLFRLKLQLNDQPEAQALEFRMDADLSQEADAFVAEFRLKSLFKEALLGRMEEMVHHDRREDAADIIDLI